MNVGELKTLLDKYEDDLTVIVTYESCGSTVCESEIDVRLVNTGLSQLNCLVIDANEYEIIDQVNL